jgi:hypothetical protein
LDTQKLGRRRGIGAVSGPIGKSPFQTPKRKAGSGETKNIYDPTNFSLEVGSGLFFNV